MRRRVRIGGLVVVLAAVVGGCTDGGGGDVPTAVPATTVAPGTTQVGAVATTVPPPPPVALGTTFDVTAYGAVADGRSDSTDAFQAAVDAAAAEGGTVVVPPGTASGGYVLNGTVTVPGGVAIVGSPAGATIDPGGPYPWPGTDVPGAKLLVRPVDAGQPAFRLASGTTVRGLWISYDQQPLPSDAELSAIDGDYAFRSFDNARTFFVDEHVEVMAPTFVIDEGDNVTIADIIADRYYDFLYLSRGGPLRVDNVTLYGYNKGFVVEDSDRRNIFTNIHFRPAVGPIVPGPDETDRWSWVFGAIASRARQRRLPPGDLRGVRPRRRVVRGSAHRGQGRGVVRRTGGEPRRRRGVRQPVGRGRLGPARQRQPWTTSPSGSNWWRRRRPRSR